MPDKLSVVIITKNESANIRCCLESVKWADELIVVDSGSTDATVPICEEFSCKILHRDWDGYASQKNFAISQATGDWILSLDADEVVTDELHSEIAGILNGKASYDAYKIPRRNFFLGKPMTRGGWYPDCQLRLFRRDIGEFAVIPLHEHIRFYNADTKVGRLSNDMLHHTYPSIRDFVAKADRYTNIEVDAMLKEGRRPKSLIFSMVTCFPMKFVEVYLYKGGWKDGIHGFVAATLMAARVFMRNAKLWEAISRANGLQKKARN